ncbi:MAG: phenylacetate--CoA ligase family protein [Chitinophagales bacterium]|nr:phenylacetate--CoA ligase family protein [Chitinophagales bacterium]
MSLFEKILQLKGYPIGKAKADLIRLQSMSKDEFIHWQTEKAWQIAKLHFDNNALYKQLVGNIFPDRWEDLPVVTKKDLQLPLQQMLSSGIKLSDCHTGSTSGSSGTPFFYAKDKMAHAMTWAVIADRYSWYGIDLSSKQARFYGIPKELLANKKEVFKDGFMNRQRFSVFDLSDKALDGFIKRFQHNAFDYIYGYTNSLVTFARHLLSKGLTLKEITPTLKICISTSETCTPEDHTILEQAFGVPNIREYGISETCITAFDAPDGKWRLTEETLLTETLEDNRIISTSLYNMAMPMIRYETSDVGIISNERAGIYRSLEQLSGRLNDTIVLPSGKKAAGLTFYYISRSVLEASGVLKEFIIRQTKLNEFVFDIVADRDLAKNEVDLVKEKITLYLEPDLNIIINRVSKIDRPLSGKLKHFYSELN